MSFIKIKILITCRGCYFVVPTWLTRLSLCNSACSCDISVCAFLSTSSLFFLSSSNLCSRYSLSSLSACFSFSAFNRLFFARLSHKLSESDTKIELFAKYYIKIVLLSYKNWLYTSVQHCLKRSVSISRPGVINQCCTI